MKHSKKFAPGLQELLELKRVLGHKIELSLNVYDDFVEVVATYPELIRYKCIFTRAEIDLDPDWADTFAARAMAALSPVASL